jgi:hypothetical protein
MRLRPLEDSSICARAIQHRSSISTPQCVLQWTHGIALVQSGPSCPQKGSDGSYKYRHLERNCEEKRGDEKWMMLLFHLSFLEARPIFFLAWILQQLCGWSGKAALILNVHSQCWTVVWERVLLCSNSWDMEMEEFRMFNSKNVHSERKPSAMPNLTWYVENQCRFFASQIACT